MGRLKTVLAALVLGCLVPGQASLAGPNPRELEGWPASYPEGPLWRDGRLYYAEMPRNRVMRWSPGDPGPEVFWSRPDCGPTSIAPYGDGGFVILCHFLDILVAVTAEGKDPREIRTDDQGGSFNNPNDSIADDRGGVYFSGAGEFDLRAPATGIVYYLASDGEVTRQAQGLRYANGLVIDRERRRLFVSEHLARKVWTFPIDNDGRLGKGEVFADLNALARPIPGASPLAGPDGLELDGQGRLYICEYGGGRVLVVEPDGRLLTQIPWSQPYLTNIALEPGSGTLFLTGAETNVRFPYPGRVGRLASPVH